MAVSVELIAILACPKCKGPVRLTAAGDGLGCGRCGVAYPITDDIPVMLLEEAVPWTPPGGAGPA
jgi:uncharacterized protein YbaR (Trm112 family)